VETKKESETELAGNNQGRFREHSAGNWWFVQLRIGYTNVADLPPP
jgi:hypothetical protein